MRALHIYATVSALGASAVLFSACSDSIHLDPEPRPSPDPMGTGGAGGASGLSCESNSDCPAPTAVCDAVKQLCVECLDYADCGFRPGTVCSAGSCVCPKAPDQFCAAQGSAPARCVDLNTSGDDCGSCSHACFGACNMGKCADAWEPTEKDSAPSPRTNQIAVWTGSAMIIWGGASDAGNGSPLNTGAIFNAATGTWTAISTANAPSARTYAAAIWTGTKMVVWGGWNGGTYLNTGGVFDPGTNTWRPTTMTDAPEGRYAHTAVWTGSKMVVWGGIGAGHLNTGGVYDPALDKWDPITTAGAPSPRRDHVAVWANDQMLIFGGFGYDDVTLLDSQYLGGIHSYNVGTGTWTPLSTASQPSPRRGHTAVWTGSDMVVWGGEGPGMAYLADGVKYSLQQNAWTPMNGPFPTGRSFHTAVWINNRMIIWGGYNGGRLGDGGLYDPNSNTWDVKGMPTALGARSGHTSIDIGGKMVVWGGTLSNGATTDTGGLFDPAFTP